jgi:STAM-binding protein
MMTCSSDTINIAARTQKIDVDNRFSLRIYYRIADNILKQADIFRAEKNVIDLYVMLLRFCSLVSETIPRHRDYRTSPQSKKELLRKKLLTSVIELEKLKPLAQQKINELNSRKSYQHNGRENFRSNYSTDISPVKKQTMASYNQIKAVGQTAGDSVYRGSRAQQFSYVRPVEDNMKRLSLTLPPPKEETLSRHSILGPNGLKGQWQPPTSDKGVRYPTIIDLSPVEIPSLRQSLEDGPLNKKENSISEHNGSDLESIRTQSEDCQVQRVDETPSLISFEETEDSSPIKVIRQPSPPPVLAEVQDLIPTVSPHVDEAVCKTETPSSDSFVRGESPLQLHIVRVQKAFYH